MKPCLTIIACCLINSLFACDTPVFRYAMERWVSSPYRVRIFHHRDLNRLELKLLAKLENSVIQKNDHANLIVETIDLSRQKVVPTASLPVKSDVELQVAYPLDCPVQRTFWQSPLNSKAVDQLLYSPTRRLIGEHLTNGSPIVWLFIQGENKKQSADKLKLLKESLVELEKSWAIPQLTDNTGKYKVDLSPIVERPALNASDGFLQTLLKSVKPEHLKSRDAMLFSFYGQGRVLNALTGEDINLKKIKEQADFLLGKCSCIVKEQNPGIDVLFNTDWSYNLGNTWIEDEPQPAVTGFDGFIEEVELPELPAAAPEQRSAKAAPPLTSDLSPVEPEAKTAHPPTLSPLIKISVIIIFIIILTATILLIKREE